MSHINHNNKGIKIPSRLQFEYDAILLLRRSELLVPPSEYNISERSVSWVEPYTPLALLQELEIDVAAEFAVALEVFNNCADGVDLILAQAYFIQQFGIGLTQSFSLADQAKLILQMIDDLGCKPSELVSYQIINQGFIDSWNEIEENKDGMQFFFNEKDLKLIPSNLFECKKVEILSLYNNQLNALPTAIGKLANTLDVLDLQENFLQSLPEAMNECQGLYLLVLKNNLFTTFPGVVFHLKNLQEINLKGNELCEHIDPEILNSLRKRCKVLMGKNVCAKKSKIEKE